MMGIFPYKYTKTFPETGAGLLPYGMANIAGSTDAVLVTDPALGLAVYNFSLPKTTFTPFKIDGEIATCWAEYTERTNTFWLTDPDAAQVYEVVVDHNTLRSTLLNTFKLAKMNNPTDLAIGLVSGKEYAYVLSPAATSVNVFSLKKGQSKHVQMYNFGKKIKEIKINPADISGMVVFTV